MRDNEDFVSWFWTYLLMISNFCSKGLDVLETTESQKILMAVFYILQVPPNYPNNCIYKYVVICTLLFVVEIQIYSARQVTHKSVSIYNKFMLTDLQITLRLCIESYHKLENVFYVTLVDIIIIVYIGTKHWLCCFYFGGGCLNIHNLFFLFLRIYICCGTVKHF